MSKKSTYEDDWKQEAPLLASLQGAQPQEAPEGYFDELPGSIMERIRQRAPTGEQAPPPSDTSRIPPGRSSFWNWRNLGYAAAIALLLGTGIFFLSQGEGADSPPLEDLVAIEQQIEALSSADIIDFVGIEAVEDDLIQDLMGDEALAAMEDEALFQDGEAFIEDIDWQDVDLNGFDDATLQDLDAFLNE